MEMKNLPVELWDTVISFIESPSDLANIARVNKLMSNIARPYFSRFLTFAIPAGNSDWRVQETFEKIKEHQLRNVRHIEVMHLNRIEKWGSNDMCLSFPYGVKYGQMGNVERGKWGLDKKAREGYEMTPLIFNERLAQLFRSLKPGQLQSFRFDRHGYTNVFYEAEVYSQTLKALNGPQTKLTKLALTFDPCLQSDDCTVFNFPYLVYFRYSCMNVSERYHKIFSLLSSCQETLEVLDAANVMPLTRRGTNTGTGLRQLKMGSGFDAWNKCGICQKLCQRRDKDGKKRIRLIKLRTLKCSGSSIASYVMAMIFEKEKIIEPRQLLSYKEKSSFSMSSQSLDSAVEWQKYFSHPTTDGTPASQQQVVDYFRATSGLTKLKVNRINTCTGDSGWRWVEGLRMGHRESLRKLTVTYWSLVADEEDVEYIGKSLPNLEKLAIRMKESIQPDITPDCVLDKAVFPKLREFRNIEPQIPIESTLKEKLCQKIFDSLKQGKFSSNLQKICFGKADYVLTIHRASNDSCRLGHRKELEEMVFEGGLLVDEALERYGIKVTEAARIGLRPEYS